MKTSERTFGAVLALSAASLSLVAAAQYPSPAPGYVGRPVYFDGPDRTTRVGGQAVPPGAVGYTPQPGGGLTWVYGSGGSSSPRMVGPSFPSYGPSYGPSFGPSYGPYGPPPGPGLPPFGGVVVLPQAPSRPADVYVPIPGAGVTWFDGRKFATVNGQRPPADAVGWRFDGSTGTTTFLTQADRDAMENRTRPNPATVATAPSRPATSTAPTVPAGPSAEEVARRTLETRRAELVAFAERRTGNDVTEAVRKRKADAIARLASTYAEIPEPPAAVDPVEDKAFDNWVSAVDAKKFARLRALYQLASNASLDDLKKSQAVWMGRCVLPDSAEQETGAMIALYPSGDSARFALNTRPYDPKKKEYSDLRFSDLAAYDSNEVGEVGSKLFELSQIFNPLAKRSSGEIDATMKPEALARSVIGVPHRVTLKSIQLGTTAALVTQTEIETSGKGYAAVGYCLFTKRWGFR